MKIHPVFHISLLDCYIESDIPGCVQPPPPPIIVDNNEFEYEVEEILDSRLIRNRLYYLVKWIGYLASDNSWEPISHLSNCKDLINNFHSRYPKKPSAPLPRSPQSMRKRQKHGVNFVSTCIIYLYPDSTLMSLVPSMH